MRSFPPSSVLRCTTHRACEDLSTPRSRSRTTRSRRTTIGLIFARGLASDTCLQSLVKDHLVKNAKPYSHALSSRTIFPHIQHSSVGSAVVVAGPFGERPDGDPARLC